MFLAPAFLWIGAALLLLRLRGRAFRALAAGGRSSSMRRFLLTSAARRGAAINRALLVLGLLLAFGVELGVFAATYDQQVSVDAQLTLGADVVASAPTGSPAQKGLAQRVAAVRGVRGVTGLDHTYAYVGPDLQDTFGIDPSTLTRGTTLRDSYFVGDSAGEMLRRLRTRSDGVLVSQETIHDYSLRPGDLLKLRVLDRRTHAFRIVPFHVVGVVQEFPSAPHDSFIVANLRYLLGVTHDPAPNVVFARAAGDPSAVARRVAARVPGALVQDIRQQATQTASSITTVQLRGIARIEEAFTLALAAAALILFATVALAERRLELATMAALGASLRQTASFLWSEAALVVASAVALAALLGWLLAEMLVAMLRHVFDPPPDHLAGPWGYLASLVGAAVVGAALAAVLARREIRRLPLGATLREE
jgi:putative ABC transport system permease protein